MKALSPRWVAIPIIFFVAIAAVIITISGEEGNSLRARFDSWIEDFDEVKSDYNSLVQSWSNGVISNSTFYSSSEIYYNDSFTGKFQELESDLWEIDDDAYGTEWSDCSQKMIEGIALWNNGVYYAREYARTGDSYFLTLASNYVEESTSKFNQAISLKP